VAGRLVGPSPESESSDALSHGACAGSSAKVMRRGPTIRSPICARAATAATIAVGGAQRPHRWAICSDFIDLGLARGLVPVRAAVDPLAGHGYPVRQGLVAAFFLFLLFFGCEPALRIDEGPAASRMRACRWPRESVEARSDVAAPSPPKRKNGEARMTGMAVGLEPGAPLAGAALAESHHPNFRHVQGRGHSSKNRLPKQNGSTRRARTEWEKSFQLNRTNEGTLFTLPRLIPCSSLPQDGRGRFGTVCVGSATASARSLLRSPKPLTTTQCFEVGARITYRGIHRHWRAGGQGDPERLGIRWEPAFRIGHKKKSRRLRRPSHPIHREPRAPPSR